MGCQQQLHSTAIADERIDNQMVKLCKRVRMFNTSEENIKTYLKRRFNTQEIIATTHLNGDLREIFPSRVACFPICKVQISQCLQSKISAVAHCGIPEQITPFMLSAIFDNSSVPSSKSAVLLM